mmetsp:Transcript_71821/g.166143  ORF Transcript_71821/g.166143 Transcript_71821/m.166143 type:complete len:272 (+) Transcript_71821:115-930(+)|eukprot:CAMPEP_0171064514 /NCGR_PEP_ID=MMETSP0766_2-20121228/6333_1 /TAXON_ID=439317 /ORGANISM="Gambierdiscus australes, Strain CAWD 149" /LENGTH=271 /DNA_ID=CAMNT_0011520553 /DNA_START=109 /DNA_END=924 /DNA_ORIENTATION=+
MTCVEEARQAPAAPSSASAKLRADMAAEGNSLATGDDLESVPSTEFASDASDSERGESDDSEWASSSTFEVEDTLLIFDWDDTMLPTRWLESQGLSLDSDRAPSEEQLGHLQTLAEHARQTLKEAASHGTVVLVTNAEHGWVELSCQRFMPSLWPYLQGTRVFSARSTFERTGIAEPSEWKFLAFAREIGAFCSLPSSGRRKNFVSIGDSPHERSALIRATEGVAGCCAKSLKLMEKPDIAQLVQEHRLLIDCLADVVGYDGSLDVCIRGS